MRFLVRTIAWALVFSYSQAFQSLLVVCREEFIQATVVLSRPLLYGMVFAEPDHRSCAVLTGGELHVTLYLPLTEPAASKCGVIKRGSVYTAILTTRIHHQIEMTGDTSFLVQCSNKESRQPVNLPKSLIQLEILKSDLAVTEAMVEEDYAVELTLENNYAYKVTSCIAFGKTEKGLEIVPLIDNLGCPFDGERMTPFYPVNRRGRLRAELSMFRFNGSHQMLVQCSIARCPGLECLPSFCLPGGDGNLVESEQALPRNLASVVASRRISVADKIHLTTIVEQVGCPAGSMAKQIVFLVLTGVGTVLLCFGAVFNRPFRCKIQLRQGSLKTCRDLLEITDADNDTQKKSRPIIVQYRRRFPFPLAMPPFPISYRPPSNATTVKHVSADTVSTPDGSEQRHSKTSPASIDCPPPPIYENTISDARTLRYQAAKTTDPEPPTRDGATSSPPTTPKKPPRHGGVKKSPPTPPPRWCSTAEYANMIRQRQDDDDDESPPPPPPIYSNTVGRRCSLDDDDDDLLTDPFSDELFPPPPPSAELLLRVPPPPVAPKPLFVLCPNETTMATDDCDDDIQQYRAVSECYQTLSRRTLQSTAENGARTAASLLTTCHTLTDTDGHDGKTHRPMNDLILTVQHTTASNKVWFYDF